MSKSVFISAMGVANGFITNLVAAVKKLGGTDEQLHELFVGKKSEEFIANISKVAMKMVGQAKAAFPIFKTITIGLYDSAKAYRKALDKSGFRIGDWASDILDKIRVSRKQIQLDLVKVTVRDLGFTESTPLKQIYAKAKELGLEPCPSEVGPALRLAYADQPNGELIYVAMEPITVSDGSLGLFEVSHGPADRWLYSGFDHPAHTWGLAYSFVFVRPRK